MTSEAVLALWAAIGITYLFVYPRNKLFGGIAITMLGLTMELALPGEAIAGIYGWIITGAGMLNTIYEVYNAASKM